MNKYFKEFLHRGLIFAGFGPIVIGVIYVILSKTINNLTISGTEVFGAILATYAIAFVQAGSTVFNQIEHWPTMKGLLCQLLSLYVTYVTCYLTNSWIPFDFRVVLLFTVIFVVGYFAIWGIVYLCVKGSAKKLNEKLV